MPKFWVSLRKSPELASKYAWVRPENRSELGAQNRKNNTEYIILEIGAKSCCSLSLEAISANDKQCSGKWNLQASNGLFCV